MYAMATAHPNFLGRRPRPWRRQQVDADVCILATKRTDGEVGIVHYGAEVITDSQNRLAALQGASPGASASVLIVPEVIFKCLYGGVCYGNSHMIGYRELSGCCEC